MTSMSGSRDTADQRAIEATDGTRPSPAILAAAIPTATCPTLATFPDSGGARHATGDEHVVGAGLELGMVERHRSWEEARVFEQP